jgi:hypothetical protein
VKSICAAAGAARTAPAIATAIRRMILMTCLPVIR